MKSKRDWGTVPNWGDWRDIRAGSNARAWIRPSFKNIIWAINKLEWGLWAKRIQFCFVFLNFAVVCFQIKFDFFKSHQGMFLTPGFGSAISLCLECSHPRLPMPSSPTSIGYLKGTAEMINTLYIHISLLFYLSPLNTNQYLTYSYLKCKLIAGSFYLFCSLLHSRPKPGLDM